MRKQTIQPKGWYGLQDIVRGGFFPWARNIATIRKYVEADRKAKNILKAAIAGEGRGTKYRIKGENILRFIREFEAGRI